MRLLILSAFVLISSGQAMAIESTMTSTTEVPLSFHVGAGVTAQTSVITPVFDLEFGVGLTSSFSLRARANMFLTQSTYISALGVATGRAQFCFGVIPSFGVRRKYISINLGPYVGAMGNRALVGAAGTLLLHFGQGIGFTFAPLFFAELGNNGGTVATMTGGIGIEL